MPDRPAQPRAVRRAGRAARPGRQRRPDPGQPGRCMAETGPPRRRRDWPCAVRTGCRCLGRSPDGHRPAGPGADHPAVLWGDWFGGGVVVVRRSAVRGASPARRRARSPYSTSSPTLDRRRPRTASSAAAGWPASDMPRAVPLSRSTTRCCAGTPAEGWCFETLGLEGREAADAAALARWRRPLADAGTYPRRRLDSARCSATRRRAAGWPGTDYLAAVEEVDRPDPPGRLLSAQPLHSGCTPTLAEPVADAVRARWPTRLRPAYAALVDAGPADADGRQLQPRAVPAGARSAGHAPRRSRAPAPRTGAIGSRRCCAPRPRTRPRTS